MVDEAEYVGFLGSTPEANNKGCKKCGQRARSKATSLEPSISNRSVEFNGI